MSVPLKFAIMEFGRYIGPNLRPEKKPADAEFAPSYSALWKHFIPGVLTAIFLTLHSSSIARGESERARTAVHSIPAPSEAERRRGESLSDTANSTMNGQQPASPDVYVAGMADQIIVQSEPGYKILGF